MFRLSTELVRKYYRDSNFLSDTRFLALHFSVHHSSLLQCSNIRASNNHPVLPNQHLGNIFLRDILNMRICSLLQVLDCMYRNHHPEHKVLVPDYPYFQSLQHNRSLLGKDHHTFHLMFRYPKSLKESRHKKKVSVYY